VVEARTPDLVNRLEASRWRIEVPGVESAELTAAWHRLTDAQTVPVQRMMKQGLRTLDLRPALVVGEVTDAGPLGAVLELTVANVTPTVRPEEILVALREIGGLTLSDPARSTRLAQGPLLADGLVGDPLAVDRAAAEPASV
jgi:hypothetical protein